MGHPLFRRMAGHLQTRRILYLVEHRCNASDQGYDARREVSQRLGFLDCRQLRNLGTEPILMKIPSTEVIECPFCGNTESFQMDSVCDTGGNLKFVRCSECKSEGPKRNGAPKNAMTAWNKRSTAVKKSIEELMDALICDVGDIPQLSGRCNSAWQAVRKLIGNP